ncbi:MAG: flavin reductase family protein, partial [Bacteroidota bacterium]
MGITTIDPDKTEQRRLYHLLSGAVAPRPICFASTVDAEGNVNLSPYSFFNVFSSKPPMLIFSPVRKGRDNTTKDTHKNILQTKEVVINMVNFPIVEQMSLTSTSYPAEVNEFVKAGLTEIPSEKVRPPRVAESPVSFECVVDDVMELGSGPGAGNLVLARVVLIHVQSDLLDEDQKIDTTKIDLVARMGGSWYTRANADALFEIPRPLRTMGIGVDQLPESIRFSNILTGNNLGRLGNVEQLPSNDEIREIYYDKNI